MEVVSLKSAEWYQRCTWIIISERSSDASCELELIKRSSRYLHLGSSMRSLQQSYEVVVCSSMDIYQESSRLRQPANSASDGARSAVLSLWRYALAPVKILYHFSLVSGLPKLLNYLWPQNPENRLSSTMHLIIALAVLLLERRAYWVFALGVSRSLLLRDLSISSLQIRK